MKRQFFLLFLFILPFIAHADHITGGNIYYTYEGIQNGQYVYKIYVEIYKRCASTSTFPDTAYISVFDKATNARLFDAKAGLLAQQPIMITQHSPCIVNPPDVCYVVASYNFTITVAPSAQGYSVVSQFNFRVAGISNLNPNPGLGATYIADIPGMATGPGAADNSSAKFINDNLVEVCSNSHFSYSFAATDPDGDQLRYSFFPDAFDSNGGGSTLIGMPASGPPYFPVPYIPPFSGSSPLGNTAKIDSQTGLITGTAPAEGIYVVAVCVQEIRNGVVIATQRKELQISVSDCTVPSAFLLPFYNVCGNSKTLIVNNESASPLINSYYWQVFNRDSVSLFTSTAAQFNYTFPDSGLYTIKLVVNRGLLCPDSTTSSVNVFPGLRPAFNTDGICFSHPVVITDQSTSTYGTITMRQWDFGDFSSNNENAVTVNHVYGTTGKKKIQLVITDSKGCRDTADKEITIVTGPPIQLAFRDTLICAGDKLSFVASGSGTVNWTPLTGIINANTFSPTVSPSVTTTYFVHLDAGECANDDSVKVNVVDHISLTTMPDTVVCSGDTIQLRANANALHYSWTPAAQLNNAAVLSPAAITTVSTTYRLTATTGGCTASGTIDVNTIPYPYAKTSAGKTICYPDSVQLQGAVAGSRYSWSPPESLSDPFALNPVARPGSTTAYVLSVFDTIGCPKPGTDTTLIIVSLPVKASVVHDTAAVVGQALQLSATGGSYYLWTPSTGLSDATIAGPVALYHSPSQGIRYTVYVFNEAACRDSAYVNVKVYNTAPVVFVPSAFTPDGDGLNDWLRPVAAGIKDIDYFNVYDRWGKLVFSTRVNGQGWDGTLNGRLQPTGTFVWVLKATDYNGGPYFAKGVTTLIR